MRRYTRAWLAQPWYTASSAPAYLARRGISTGDKAVVAALERGDLVGVRMVTLDAEGRETGRAGWAVPASELDAWEGPVRGRPKKG